MINKKGRIEDNKDSIPPGAACNKIMFSTFIYFYLINIYLKNLF